METFSPERVFLHFIALKDHGNTKELHTFWTVVLNDPIISQFEIIQTHLYIKILDLLY